MSMAAKCSDSEGQTLRANFQTKGHIPKPLGGWKDPEEMGALDSAPFHLPSWSPARKPSPGCPNTRHCPGIHMTLNKETWAVPPPPHVWMVPLVEDMLCYGTTGLTEAIVMGLGRVVLFDGRWSMGEGLSLGKVTDAAFVLTWAGTLSGKPAYLATDPLTIQECCLGYHRMLDRGKRDGTATLKSFNPATISILPSGRFSPKRLSWRCQFQPSTITPQAAERPRLQLMGKRPGADTTSTTLIFHGL